MFGYHSVCYIIKEIEKKHFEAMEPLPLLPDHQCPQYIIYIARLMHAVYVSTVAYKFYCMWKFIGLIESLHVVIAC